jgi:hypothetical protein
VGLANKIRKGKLIFLEKDEMRAAKGITHALELSTALEDELKAVKEKIEEFVTDTTLVITAKGLNPKKRDEFIKKWYEFIQKAPDEFDTNSEVHVLFRALRTHMNELKRIVDKGDLDTKPQYEWVKRMGITADKLITAIEKAYELTMEIAEHELKPAAERMKNLKYVI